MQTHIESRRKAKPDAGLRLLQRFGYAAAALFALAGLVMLYGARDHIPPLEQPDPVFGLSTRAVLVVAGLLHLAVSGCLFAMRDPMKQGLIAGWAGLNSIVYLAGVAWLKTAGSLPAVVVVAWELGVSEKTVQLVWRLFIAYLVTIGLLLVILDWRETKRVDLEAFWKRWTVARRQGTHPPTPPNRGGTGAPQEAQAAEFKFSCPSCGQHIRCEQSYAGKEINCPACHKPFRVPEIIPARSGVSVGAARH